MKHGARPIRDLGSGTNAEPGFSPPQRPGKSLPSLPQHTVREWAKTSGKQKMKKPSQRGPFHVEVAAANAYAVTAAIWKNQALAALSISSTMESEGVAPESRPHKPRTANMSMSNWRAISVTPLWITHTSPRMNSL